MMASLRADGVAIARLARALRARTEQEVATCVDEGRTDVRGAAGTPFPTKPI
jgi:hypothetical protein